MWTWRTWTTRGWRCCARDPDALPDHQCEVLHLRQVAELSAGEVSKITGPSITHIGVRLHRARMRLRACLEGKGWGRSDDDVQRGIDADLHGTVRGRTAVAKNRRSPARGEVPLLPRVPPADRGRRSIGTFCRHSSGGGTLSRVRVESDRAAAPGPGEPAEMKTPCQGLRRGPRRDTVGAFDGPPNRVITLELRATDRACGQMYAVAHALDPVHPIV